MRTLLALAIVLSAPPAAADIWLAGHAPPAPVKKPYVRPLLGDRWTMTAQTGVGWVEVEGTSAGGMLINPTLTRTFDRFELSTDYLALDWHDESGMRSSGTMHRVGGEVRYQVGRIRVDNNTMTLDTVVTAGLGWQHLAQDHGASIDRGDGSLGILLRMLTDIDDRENERLMFGAELGVRLLAARGGADRGFIVSFGVPLGW